MIVNQELTTSQIRTQIAELQIKLDQVADAGDKISSMGATVEYNKRYNHIRQQIEELNSMLSLKKRRGE